MIRLKDRYPLTQAILHFWQLLDFKFYNLGPMTEPDLYSIVNLTNYLNSTTASRKHFPHCIPGYHE